MQETSTVMTDEPKEQVAFVGNVLAPLFLNDPSKGAIDELLSSLTAIDAAQAGAEWPFVDDAVAAEALGLISESLNAEDWAESLHAEFCRLYVGPGHLPVPPWGSVYTDRDCVVFGAATLELRAWMRQQGISREAEVRTPEDHIGLLLALMAWLAAERPAVVGEFLELHVLPWSSHMLSQLIEEACEPFYRGLGLLTKETLEGIGAAFDLRPEKPTFYR